tara:strand:- start:18177 stop:22727 length:4551 start_codon:yes stop_codon:yes gene_type:complete
MPSWLGTEAPDGHAWLVVDLTVENDIPPSLAFQKGRSGGEALRVVQRQHLFLLHGNSGEAVAPSRIAKGAEGTLPTDFALRTVGASRTGEVAFLLPDASFERGPLQIRWYHDEVPVTRLELRGGLPVASSEVHATNELVALAPADVTFPETIAGQNPPKGTRWVAVGLRGRSLGRDPALYLESAQHLELLVDGMWARPREDLLGTGTQDPIFLPDRPTGAEAIFLAPLHARSLELSCAFPLFKLADGTQVQPVTLRLPLEGVPVQPEPEMAAVVVDDGLLSVAILSVTACEGFGELQAENGRTLLVIEGRVEAAEQGGLIGFSGRFLVDGAQPVVTLGLADLPRSEPFLVPSGGGRRAFRVVLDAPASIGTSIQMTYAGVQSRPTFDIAVEDAVPRDPDPATTPTDVSNELTLDLAWTAHATETRAPHWIPGATPLIVEPGRVETGSVTLEWTGARFTDLVNGKPVKDDEVALEVDLTVRLAADAEPWRSPTLANCLIAVVDGVRSVPTRAIPDEGGLENPLRLKPGEHRSGKVAFLVPRAGFERFSIAFVEEGRSIAHLPIVGASAPRAEPFATAENEAVRVEVLGFETALELGTKTARKGHVYVAIDLRAQHRLVVEGAPTERSPWSSLFERVQLLIDGVHPRRPLAGLPTDLSHELSLFPTETLGGRMVFEVPRAMLANADHVALVCGFEPGQVPGGGVVRPRTLRFPLVGTFTIPDLPADAQHVQDLDATLAIDAPQVVPTFQGRKPKADHTWITTEVWITAPPGRSATITPWGRFAILDTNGGVHGPHTKSWAAPSPSPRGRPFWVPDEGVRRLELVFEVPDDAVEGGVLIHRGLLSVDFLPLVEGGDIRVPAADPNRSTMGQHVYDDARVPRGLAGVGLEPHKVNRAIDRGRDFLLELVASRTRKGVFLAGATDYPVLLALVHCEAHKSDPEFARVLKRMLDDVRVDAIGVYQLGVLAMILDKLDEPEHRKLYEDVQRSLMESQGPGGSWAYPARLDPVLFPDLGRTMEDAPIEEGASSVLELTGGDVPAEIGTLLRMDRRQSPSRHSDGDNSVSQFAVLGLSTAKDNDVVFDADTWHGVVSTFASRQDLNPERGGFGGWAYSTGAGAYGSMTCSGICSLAIGLRRTDPLLDPRPDLRIRDGLAWLDRNWSVSENPAHKDWHYYYLYGLERVGQILGLDFIGSHEWYPEGARFLVENQKGDGSWSGSNKEKDPRIATSFALLFLTRATESLELDEPEPAPDIGPGALVTTHDMPPGDESVYIILDASGSMLSKVEGRRKFDVARDAVRELLAALPAGTHVALRVYGHRKRAIEEGAAEDTELVTPFAELDLEAMFAQLDALRPRGKTPLTLSLQEARGDLASAPDGRGTVVVLLTDGGEDTRQDPVAAAAQWAGRSDVHFHVVGFDIDRPDWTEQLHAMAEAAEGTYVEVAEAAQLASLVVQTVRAGPPSFEVLSATDQPIAQGTFGDRVELPEGDYVLAYEHGGRAERVAFHVRPGATVTARLRPPAVR